MADTKMLGDGLNLKAAAEARRPEPLIPAKSLRHIISDDQIEALKRHKSGIEQPLMWASLGVCAGSATGALPALGAFLNGGALTMGGFVQNICFFSSLLVAVILMVIYLPRRKDFGRLIDALRARGEG